MSELKIYQETDSEQSIKTFGQHGQIAKELSAVGIRFEQWEANQPISSESTQKQILDAYREPVDRLMKECGFQTADVVNVSPELPNKEEMRKKFLQEHTHIEDEVRFFVNGKGLFYVRKEGKVYAVLCEKEDLISVPAKTTHWFDMGENPEFTAIRLFTNPEGWIANYTGNKIADRFPKF